MAYTRKEAYIIGGGPIALATGIELIENGYEVTILEAREELGLGISNRPDCNPWGIMHSGAYYPEGSMPAQYCFKIFEKFKRGEHGTLLQLYANNCHQSGKLIVAHTETGIEKLRQLAGRLDGTAIEHKLLFSPHEISKLDEPAIGNPLAVLELPTVQVINIKGYLGALQAKFKEMGGKILLSHPVTDIKFIGGKIELQAGGNKFSSSTVINMAGIYAETISGMAAEAAGRVSTSYPATPKMDYLTYGVLQRKPEYGTGPLTKHVVYAAENAFPEGSVGVHSYLSNFREGDLFNQTYGPFPFSSTLADLPKRQIPTSEITADIIASARNVTPDFEPEAYELIHVGYIARCPGRDFVTTSFKHNDAVFVNSFSSDSPGLTASPIIAEELAALMRKLKAASRVFP